MDLKDLESALTNALSSLYPSVIAENPPKFNETYLGGSNEDFEIWREIISKALDTAETFEIHCWEDEHEAIKTALKYGEQTPTDWKHGVVIVGKITDEFKAMLLSSSKPQNNEMGNRLTLFFDIFLDDAFQSCHYGTEIYH